VIRRSEGPRESPVGTRTAIKLLSARPVGESDSRVRAPGVRVRPPHAPRSLSGPPRYGLCQAPWSDGIRPCSQSSENEAVSRESGWRLLKVGPGALPSPAIDRGVRLRALAAGLSFSCLLALSPGSAASGAFGARGSPSGPASSGAQGGVWGAIADVPGAALSSNGQGSVTSVSCPAPGSCGVAGDAGSDQSGLQPFVDVQVAGSWMPPQLIPGMTNLDAGGTGIVTGLSCTAPGTCQAVGQFPGGSFIASETGGTWQAAQAVPGTSAIRASSIELSAVSCASDGSCAAAGSYIDAYDTFQPLLLAEIGGVWGSPFEIPGVLISGDGKNALFPGSQATVVSCGSPGNCLAGGSFQTTPDVGVRRAFLVREVAGRWQSAFQISGLGQSERNTVVDTVSCAAPSNCSAGGTATYGPFIVSEQGGKWNAAREPVLPVKTSNPNGIGYVSAVSCSAPNYCSAAGNVGGSRPQEFILDEDRGTWQPAVDVPSVVSGALYSIACAAPGDCSAGGIFVRATTPRTAAIVVNEVGGAIEPAIAVQGASGLTPSARVVSISCAAPGSCVAGGWSADNSSAPTIVGVVASETPGAPPSLNGLEPRSGSQSGGSRVVITGQRFLDVLAVRFGQANAGALDTVSSTKIVVTAPRGSCSVSVVVVAEAGVSPRTLASTFTYRPVPKRGRCPPAL
jgi:hypothetical protein